MIDNSLSAKRVREQELLSGKEYVICYQSISTTLTVSPNVR